MGNQKNCRTLIAKIAYGELILLYETLEDALTHTLTLSEREMLTALLKKLLSEDGKK